MYLYESNLIYNTKKKPCRENRNNGPSISAASFPRYIVYNINCILSFPSASCIIKQKKNKKKKPGPERSKQLFPRRNTRRPPPSYSKKKKKKMIELRQDRSVIILYTQQLSLFSASVWESM